MELSLKSLVLVVSLAATVAANSTFVQPPNHGPGNNYQDNPVYKEGQKVDLQWQSDLDIMDLIIFQVYPSAGKGNEFFYKVKQNTRSTSLIWTASLDRLSSTIPQGQDAILYFSIQKPNDPDKDGLSHYFNITVNQDKPTPTAQPTTLETSSVSMPSATPSATSSGAPGATTTSDPETGGGSSSGGLSKGATAGVAVGATIGGIVVLAGLGFLAWRMMRNRGSTQGQPVVQEEPKHELAGPPPNSYYEPNKPDKPTSPIYEAP